jgi:hypothetical protein
MPTKLTECNGSQHELRKADALKERDRQLRDVREIERFKAG